MYRRSGLIGVAEPDSGGAYPPFGLCSDVVLLPDRSRGLHGGQDLVGRFIDPASTDALPWRAQLGRV
jgi:hypothetical protein